MEALLAGKIRLKKQLVGGTVQPARARVARQMPDDEGSGSSVPTGAGTRFGMPCGRDRAAKLAVA